MYIAKVYINKQLKEVRLYENYEHFISDLIDCDSELYDNLPEEVKDKISFKEPKIFSGCCDDIGFLTDFEYRYQDGLMVYCGEAMTEEEFFRKK